jgi:ribonucleoside-diphosphate reductase alpha chain
MQIKYTKKRDGRIVPFDISKIQEQINFAVKGSSVSAIEFESLLHFGYRETITSDEIQQTIINVGAQQISIENKSWDTVVGRADMYNLYRQVFKRTKHKVQDWQNHIKYLVRNDYYRKDILDYLDCLTQKQISQIDKIVNEKNFDFNMTYAQVEILKSKYLIKNKRGVIEYPIIADITNALILSRGDKHFYKIFKMIHNQLISLATPFKRNLRRPNGNVGSCFIGENVDSLTGLTKAFSDMAFISKEGGGIGWYLGKVRPEDTYSYKIVKSNNITKWAKIINDIAVAVNQGGARPGAITLGLDWWHMDIHSFLDIKSELNGDLRDKAFDIFPQVIIDKWFLEKKQKDEDVILFNHYEYKKQFGVDITELIEEDLYRVHKHVEELVTEGKFPHHKVVKAKDLWKKILWTWIEIGDFYIVNKDKLNSSNYLKYDPEGGIAKQANLCVESFSFSKTPKNWIEKSNGEIRETTETDGLYHSCNLLSIVATNLVKATDEQIKEVCYYATLILDRSIDEGEMPVFEAKKMSELIRNIGIGLVGMGDMMAYNNMMYNTEEGQNFGEKFVEKISFYCYSASHELAKEHGSYPLFKPENYNKILGKDPKVLNKLSLNGFDWDLLAKNIREEGGIRNFYLLAFAPNSSTGILMGAVASYLPVYNKEMVQTLDDLSLPIIPKFIDKHLWSYKTKFQYHPKDIIICTDKWQKWIDTGMSMEININPELCKINEISDIISDRMLNGDLKTVYYSLTIDNKKNGEGCTDCAN